MVSFNNFRTLDPEMADIARELIGEVTLHYDTKLKRKLARSAFEKADRQDRPIPVVH